MTTERTASAIGTQQNAAPVTLESIAAQLAILVQFTEDIRSLAATAPKMPFLPDFSRVARKD